MHLNGFDQLLKNPRESIGYTLRHTFAMHLLEQEANMRYSQLLPGHRSSKTTESYTHIASHGLESIVSPAC